MNLVFPMDATIEGNPSKVAFDTDGLVWYAQYTDVQGVVYRNAVPLFTVIEVVNSKQELKSNIQTLASNAKTMVANRVQNINLSTTDEEFHRMISILEYLRKITRTVRDIQTQEEPIE